MKTFSFPKHQRLTLKKDIEALFRQGKSFHSGPLRVIFHYANSSKAGIRVLITVPRKKFRNASDRNRIRRLIRETYRLNRPLYFSDDIDSANSMNIGFIYTGDNTEIAFDELAAVMSECLKKLALELNHPAIED